MTSDNIFHDGYDYFAGIKAVFSLSPAIIAPILIVAVIFLVVYLRRKKAYKLYLLGYAERKQDMKKRQSDVYGLNKSRRREKIEDDFKRDERNKYNYEADENFDFGVKFFAVAAVLYTLAFSVGVSINAMREERVSVQEQLGEWVIQEYGIELSDKDVAALWDTTSPDYDESYEDFVVRANYHDVVVRLFLEPVVEPDSSTEEEPDLVFGTLLEGDDSWDNPGRDWILMDYESAQPLDDVITR